MFAGYSLFGWALATVSASTATTLSLLEPAVAAILAVTVVGERLPVAGWAGLTLIAGCLIVLTVGGRAVLPFLYFATAGCYRRLFDGRHIITRLSRYGREVGSARL
jgi:drug/metabolite transporter (DMT)-like permease